MIDAMYDEMKPTGFDYFVAVLDGVTRVVSIRHDSDHVLTVASALGHVAGALGVDLDQLCDALAEGWHE